MGRWTLDGIDWNAFDRARVDPDIVPIVKAASLVESNARDYGIYLCNVFADDPRMKRAALGWVEEELVHGRALARWAGLADPGFDFDRAFARFTAGFRLPLEATASVRGSRAGELISRCMVETGTSSFYKVLGDATEEPVLREICRHIERDELAHYELFHRHLGRYLHREHPGWWSRLRVAVSRIAEAEDDELAYAYYAANAPEGASYHRSRYADAYALGTLRYVAPDHFERGAGMVLNAVAFTRGATAVRWVFSRIVWAFLRLRFLLRRRWAALTANPTAYADR